SRRPMNSSQGYHQAEIQHNEYGRPTEIAYYDAAKQPVADEIGIQKIVRRYDDRGLLLEESIYGPNGQLIQDRAGIARVRYEYNAKRQRTLIEYFGANGPAQGPNGAHRLITHYDDSGRQIDVTRIGGSAR